MYIKLINFQHLQKYMYEERKVFHRKTWKKFPSGCGVSKRATNKEMKYII